MSDEVEKKIGPGDEPVLTAGTKVTYGAGRKVSDGNYGSYDFHCSISVDVKPGETPIDTIKEGIAFVERVIGNKVGQVGSKKKPLTY